ncbi:hypothetical protein [Pimelobacter simplex]|uniref:hypothetical protein n=1 Tax=Nocardioides simplex TaxID=2045 RepID=UPI0021502BE6|nr:hypothetical protein [Pimelobacter simplex]UUW89468.1 hypothetical protein M0M43_27625 [Pimelobacter simplex]UUW93297.1 hypothetical protein M0M48_16280 [Pimelobacter simplex]
MIRLTAGLAAAAILLTAAPAGAAETAAPTAADDDLQPPTITITTPAGVVDGWSTAAFDVTVRVSDTGGSGLAGSEWELSGATGGSGSIHGSTLTTIPITGAGPTTLTVTSRDRAGNETTRGVDLGVDTAAPSIMLGPNLRSIDQTTVAPGTKVVADFECVDAESGIAACTAAVLPGQVVDTDAIPGRALVIHAKDKVGRTSQYTVSWATDLQTFTLAEPLAFTGSATVGDRITVRPPSFSPAPDTISYQWLLDGQPVPGATGTSLGFGPAERDRTVTLQVRPHRNGYADSPFTSTPVRVAGRTIQLNGEVTVEGIRRPGHPLTATVTGLFDPSDVTLTYRWFRDSVLHPIPGATSATYTPTPGDAGQRLIARVVADAPGHKTFTAERTVEVGFNELAALGNPGVTGTPRVGAVLTAVAPSYTPTATVSYQWLRGGTPISRATGASYRLTGADTGARITVRIVARADGFRDHVGTALPTAPVARAAATVTVRAQARRGGVVVLTVTVRAPGVLPSGVVKVRRGPVVRLTQGTARIRLAKQPRGKATYTVTYGGDAGVGTASAKVRVKVR